MVELPAPMVPLNAPLKPFEYVRLLTVKVALPVLAMVSVALAVVPVVTLPKARVPLSPMMRVATAVPVPDAAIVLLPLVLSELTVTMLL